MQVVLVMFRSDGERRSFSVVRNMTIIGRREDCDLRIPVGDVSRKHCRILTSDEGVTIEDLGSSNGTYVNHQRVQHSELNPGDTVGVGPVQFVIQIDGVPDDEEMTAPTPPQAASEVDPDDSEAGYHAPTAVHEEDELVAEEPAEELVAAATIDESPLEHVAADDLASDELVLEEEPEALQEPLEELEEIDEVPDADVEEVESLEEMEETVVPHGKLDEAPLAADAGEVDNLEDLELEEVPAKPANILDDDLEALPIPPPAHAGEAIEELALDDDEPAAPHTNGNGSNGGTAEGSAWDFVIEETETEPTPHELHIDLDAPHQQHKS